MAASHSRTAEEHRLFEVARETFGFGPSKCWRLIDRYADSNESAEFVDWVRCGAGTDEAREVAQDEAGWPRRRGDFIRPRMKRRHKPRLSTGMESAA